MVKKQLPSDVTISEIVGNLKRPDEYVRRVLGNMNTCRTKHGSSLVRLGITGQGITPHYRVEPDFDLDRYLDDDEFMADHFVAYDGRNHERLDWGCKELRANHWSTRAKSFDEVRDLLGTIRNFKRKERRG